MSSMRFGPDDESSFFAARDHLTEAFGEWLSRPTEGHDRDTAVPDAELLLDWRWGYSTGELDRFGTQDLREFLLEWCPRKLTAPPDLVDVICPNLQAFVRFLDESGNLHRDSSPAAVLIDELDRIHPHLGPAMADESQFGMAKSMFSGLEELPTSPDELHALVQQRMDEHNALPFEERRALTDSFLSTFDPEPIELTFTHLMPADYDVRKAAASAPVLRRFDDLRDYLGPQGRPLTKKGNPKLDDARALVELLETGEAFDPQIGDHRFRTGSSAELPRLTFLLRWAEAARAVRRVKGRLVPVKTWAKADVVDRGQRVVDTLLHLGPLSGQRRNFGWFGDLHETLEDGIAHWLVTMISPVGRMPAEVIGELGVEAARPVVPPAYLDAGAPALEGMIRRDIALILEMLELAGVVTWDDWEATTDEYDRTPREGGIVHATVR